MRTDKEKFLRGKRANSLWAAFFFIFFYAYWGVMSNFVIHDFWDPQYAHKIESLEGRMEEYPNHPLWLILGTSHVECGLRPDVLADVMKKQGEPLIFNFGQTGADLFRELISLRRVLSEGVKPRRVVIEIVSESERLDQSPFVTDPDLIPRARPDELDTYRSFGLKERDIRSYWQPSRWNPAFKYGMNLPHQTLAFRLIPIPFLWRFEDLGKYPCDEWGWHTGDPAPIPRDVYRKAFELAVQEYSDNLKNLKLSEINDRALGQIMETCKTAGIDVAVLWMPEATDFQKLYSPEASAAMGDYLQKIQGEYGVQAINARLWIDDTGFGDGHHLNATGAEEFTKRLREELIKTEKPADLD